LYLISSYCIFQLKLKANNPVAVGKTRACQLSLKDGHYGDTENPNRHGDKALCIQVHGDASFAGQVLCYTFSYLPMLNNLYLGYHT
jgi:probable 2-oxoglutarate dehydrogenase E1 component DHKTD1